MTDKPIVSMVYTMDDGTDIVHAASIDLSSSLLAELEHATHCRHLRPALYAKLDRAERRYIKAIDNAQRASGRRRLMWARMSKKLNPLVCALAKEVVAFEESIPRARPLAALQPSEQ